MKTNRPLMLVAAVLIAAAALAVTPLTASALMPPPAAPVITTPADLLSRDGNVALAGTVDVLTSELRIDTPSMTMTMSVTPGGAFAANVTVPVARTASVITVTPSNGVSDGTPATLTVYNLGPVAAYPTFVLVDKSDFTLYLIKNGVVTFVRPVAIGMPGAPTPSRTWTLGARQWMPASSAWGKMRIPLLKTVIRHVRVHRWVGGHRVHRWVHRRVLVRTSFYIHGTNDPDSIGTMASHGCVRMYNADVIAFSTMAGRAKVVTRN